jgi:diguanylate cyclase (GGDEF)-like protein
MRLTSDQLLLPVGESPPKSALRQLWTWTLILVALAAIFVVDRATSSAPFQHLYYVPIIFASVRFGYVRGITTAAAAIALYHLANPHVLTLHYEEFDVVQMALFVAVSVTSARFADDARRLHRLATTDDLTGLHNLRSFEAHLRRLVRACDDASASLALLVLDLDRLKSLNDAHGHLAGAEAVRTVGHIISAHLSSEAVACRYGGDEFVIALPHCRESDARAVADDLRRAVNGCAPVLAGIPFASGTLSISVGIACRSFERPIAPKVAAHAPAGDAAGEELFRAADAALYAAKESGRNRLSVADQPRARRELAPHGASR